MATMRKTLANYFAASFPCVVVQTTDETRAQGEVVGAAKLLQRDIVTWSATEGMIDISNGAKKLQDTEDLAAACRQRKGNTIYILRDPQTWPFDRDPILLRAFRDFISAAPLVGSSVVIIAPSFKPHETCEKMMVILDFDLPSPADLREVAIGIAKSSGKEIEPTKDVIRALGGLTTTEAENALALSFIETGGFDATVIYREKIKAVKKSGLLDIVEADPRGLEAIGGLDVLKSWISRRRRAWSPEATDFGCSEPKGVLLVGVPGTGKSLSAKTIGTALGVPTLKLDIGSLFNSLVGESEARCREALKLAEALSPCVLFCDEIDKGLAGSGGSGSGDSGVTKRVFGNILNWMQERRAPVFLVASANDVTNLPPELLRVGRFDKIFAVDLPTAGERETIFGIHLKARGRDAAAFDLDALARATDTFTGSEIEGVLNEALFLAFDKGEQLQTSHMLTAAKDIVPLAVTAKDKIAALREWSKTCATAASTQPSSVPATGRRFA